jgi:hypothetical protein
MDCFLRAPVLKAADMVAAGHMMQQAVAAVLDSDACMSNTVAVAGLASAITSLAKRAVQLIRYACGVQQQQQQQQRQQLASQPWLLAAACYPAAVWSLVHNILGAFSCGVCAAAVRSTKPALPNSSSSSSSSSTSQVAASAALLAVVLARSLVQLADAMQAAGPQLLFECQRLKPAFNLKWSPGGQVYALALGAIEPPGNAAQQTVELQWHLWQLAVLHALQPLMSAMAMLGMSKQAETTENAAAAAAAGPDITASTSSSGQAPNPSSSSSSSSSSSNQPRWGHLLHLQRFSPDWPAALEAFDEKNPGWGEELEKLLALLLAGTPLLGGEWVLADVPIFNGALQLTRELVDAAPLPVVCNNPGCESLAGVSEAAAACKACAVCRCRYCSEGCQRADWKRHKPTCKRMAAAGMACG